MASRVAIDIGGTFTDLVHLDAGADEAGLGKVSTTPGRFEDGVMEALEGASLDGVEFLVHGTRGFRDVLEIGKGNRADLYNLEFRKPEPFVPRRLRLEVAERVDHAGDVLEPLDEDGVRSAVARAREFGAETIAVCFLHSYANPAHELRAGELIAEAWAGLPVTLSHRIVARVARVPPQLDRGSRRVSLVVPIRYRRRLVGFSVSKAHWTEVGGKDPGSWTTDATEFYQEGPQFPCVKLYEEGVPNQGLIDLIAANVRLPEMTLGDMAASLELGARCSQGSATATGPRRSRGRSS